MSASAGASVIPRKDGFYDKYIRNYQILSQSQLKRLKEHKYSSEGVSLIEPAAQVFWRWTVEQIPLWWAPNSITVVGLIINVVTTLILCIYSPDCIQEAPRWAYFMSALGLFIYQTLDAIDGKQARRTKSSSPLGELFDHGCDSVSTGFVMLGASIALTIGQDPNWLLFINMMGITLFYVAHWQTYVSGTLKFGRLDVTEGQLIVIIIHLLVTLFGTGFWSCEIPIVGVPLKMIPLYFCIFGGLLQLKTAFQVIFMEGGVGKNGSTVAGTSTVFPLFPITIIVLLAVIIAHKSPSELFLNHPCLYLLAFCLLAAKVTNRLVVAHMTKSEMDLWDTGFIGPGLLFLNQYFNCWLEEYYVLWLCLIWVSFDMLKYSTIVCQEICECLNIYCFTIRSTPSRARKDSKNGNYQEQKM